MNQSLRAGVLLAMLCLVPHECAAQFQFDSWTTENGLPQNSVNAILQTRDAYLWLATFGGLVRFDGVRFVVYDRGTEGIGSQRTRILHEDAAGTLWAATDDGMLIRYRNGRFTTFGAADGLPYNVALRIDDDEQGNLWITWNGIVTRFDGTRFVNYRPGDFVPAVSPHDFITRAGDARTYPQKFWWGQDSLGVHVLVGGRVQTHGYDSVLRRETEVTGVNADRDSNVWVHTRGAAVVKINSEGRRAYAERDGLPPEGVGFVMFEDRHGFLWLQARGHTLYQIKDGRRSAIPVPEGVAYEDREGSIWLGTAAGLYRVRSVTVALHSERDGLSSNFAYSILQARNGSIWIGTWGGGLNKFDSGRLTSYRHSEGLPSDYVTSIHEDRAGRLWAGTNAGVSYLEHGRFVEHHDEHAWLQRSVWAIHEDRDRSIWFGTDEGLVRLRAGRYTLFTTKDGLSDDRVTALLEDRSGALWIGAFHGLTRMRDGRLTTYTEREGLVGNQVRALYEDSDGVLWVGTYDGGLYRLKGERLTRYTRRDGLHDNGVFQILEDHDGNLWMGSNRGIYRVSRGELNAFAEGRARSITSVVLGTKDGLSTLECNGGRQPSGLKTSDGRLWFPTMGGVAVIDPNAVRLNTQPPSVIIEEFRRGGEAIDFAGGVEVQPSTGSFEIAYTAPSFIEPAQVRFKYKLVGLDDDWVDAGARRLASYHRIPPGRYRFVVTAANNDGVWNTQGIGVDIDVTAPWWRRWWFVAAALIAMASLVVLAHERRVSGLRHEHALQEMFSQQLIDSQESERRRISIEMHDSLGQDLTVIKVRARAGQETAAENQALKQELDEIISVADKAYVGIKEIAYDLRPYQLDIIGLSKTIDGMVKRVAKTSQTAFVTEIANIDAIVGKKGQIHLYRIVQEAVSNIVRHAQARQASVTITSAGASVEVRIADDGRGFWPAPQDVAASPGQGFGLIGIRERARILGGEVGIHSVPGGGTAIVVTFRTPRAGL